MFKKPKKNPKAKFRSVKRSVDDDEDQKDTQEEEEEEFSHDHIKRVRLHERTNGDQEGPASDDPQVLYDNSTTQQHQQEQQQPQQDGDLAALEDSTALLLQKAKMEQGQKNGGRLFHTSHKKSQPKKVSIHQQYDYQTSNNNNNNVNSHIMTEKDLATRAAEYHPVTIIEKKHKNENGDEQQQRDKDNGDNPGVVIYKGNQEPRNKFLAGPLKAPTFVRTTSRFDYQPDICKDYKDTGFCGFGDSCIYLHDRGNTLTGWQLEEQYEKMKKLQQDKQMKEMDMFCQQISGSGGGGGGGDDDDDEHLDVVERGTSRHLQDDLPFACYICRKPFTDPVVTSCNHYFCQKCIMQHVQENGKSGANPNTTSGISSACPICHRDTHGVFNYPNKLYQKRKRMDCSSWEDFAKKSSGE
mmetsp:Transcript_3537/g.6680  ORF Transcript_3537/g.6680 Transcript_3537/m.6680 type:complete len:411 (+) Transcript_3537:196-1428(+)